MIEIVPAILEQSWEEITEKVDRIKPYTSFVQLDVMDGAFVPNNTFNDTAKLRTLDIDMEVHLMIEKPDLHLRTWAMPNVKRMIVHFEAVSNMRHVIDQIRKLGKQAAVAINPGTSTYEIKDYLNELDMVVVMGVEPGFSGQSFQKDALEKIREIKKWKPEMRVEVDGGVNGYNRDAIVAAGADVLALASFIWKAENMQEAFDILRGTKKSA